MENSLWFLRKLNIELLYDPAMPVLSIHPKELKTGTQINTCIPMFIAALFTNKPKGGNNPTHLSTHR